MLNCFFKGGPNKKQTIPLPVSYAIVALLTYISSLRLAALNTS